MSTALNELLAQLNECETDLRERSRRLARFPDGQRATRHANAMRTACTVLQVFSHNWPSTQPEHVAELTGS